MVTSGEEGPDMQIIDSNVSLGQSHSYNRSKLGASAETVHTVDIDRTGLEFLVTGNEL